MHKSITFKFKVLCVTVVMQRSQNVHLPNVPSVKQDDWLTPVFEANGKKKKEVTHTHTSTFCCVLDNVNVRDACKLKMKNLTATETKTSPWWKMELMPHMSYERKQSSHR